MSSKLMQSTIQSSHLLPLLSKLKTQFPKLNTLNVRPNYTILKHITSSNHSIKVAAVAEEHDSGMPQADNDIITLTKSSVYHALEGINRGVFGVTSEKKKEIQKLIQKLETHNPTTNPTLDLDKVSGCWKLIYSTITILGSKRTKLGLRDFINLGDFLQIIDVSQVWLVSCLVFHHHISIFLKIILVSKTTDDIMLMRKMEGKAVNVIKFNARGMSMLNGQLTIQASFSVASPTRVNIKYESSKITPNQLMNLFDKNYELLLGIFNPDGWLDITYVDEEMRIGRDDKGNIFILERAKDQDQS